MAAQTATMSAGLQTCQVRSVRSAPRFQPLIPAAAARRASLRTATVAQAKRSDDSMQVFTDPCACLRQKGLTDPEIDVVLVLFIGCNEH